VHNLRRALHDLPTALSDKLGDNRDRQGQIAMDIGGPLAQLRAANNARQEAMIVP
jgi:hypothetical protein